MRWVSYQSNIYKYGLVFMCAASLLALMNDGGSTKESWDWMRQQYDLRQAKKIHFPQGEKRAHPNNTAYLKGSSDTNGQETRPVLALLPCSETVRVPSEATVALVSKHEEAGTVAAVSPSIPSSLSVASSSHKEMREEPRRRRAEVAEDVRVQQHRATSVPTSPLTPPLLLQRNREVVALGNYTSRGVEGSDEGSVSTTVTSNVTDRAGPAGNCKSGTLHSSSSRVLDLTPFAESAEDDRDDRGSKWDRTAAFGIPAPATLRISTYRTTADITTDRTRNSKNSSSTCLHLGDAWQEREKSSPDANTAAILTAGMTPPFSISLSSDSLSCAMPSVRRSSPELVRRGNGTTRQLSRKCLRNANSACGDSGRCTGPVARTTTPTTAPSTALLSSSYVACFQGHNAMPISDKDGDSSLRLRPRRCRGGSSCGSYEHWTMKPRLSGVNEVLLQSASASGEPQLFRQALAAFQLWDTLLRLELHSNSAGGTYMVRLARPSSSSATATFAATDSDSHGAVVAVFKPCDEEIGQESNPHANRESDRTETFAPGSGSRREVLAYLLDHGHNAGVPPTLEVASTYWAGVGATTANSNGGGGAATASLSTGTLGAVAGGGDAPANSGLRSSRTGGTDWRGIGADDGDSVAARVAASTHLRIGSLQLFVPGCEEAADVLPGHFDVDEVHALAIFDIRTLNGDRHGGNVLVCNYHRCRDGRKPVMARRPRCARLANAAGSDGTASSPSASSTAARLSPEMPATITTAKEDVPHLIPIDHSYICPSGYADPDYEWLSWPQSKKPFSERNLNYIAALDAVADAELVRSALLAHSGVPTHDVSTPRTSAVCNDFEMAEGQPDAALTSLTRDDAQYARAAMGCATVDAASAALASRHLPREFFGRGAAAASLDDLTGLPPLPTASTKRAVAPTTSAAAAPCASGAATAKKSSTMDGGAEAPSGHPYVSTWDPAAVELMINFDRGDSLSTEAMHKDAAAVRARAMSTAWSASSSSSTPPLESLHAGPREHASNSVAYDRDAANTAAEVTCCTTRLLQIAALEFHMTAYEIGSLCRRPRVTQASVLEEVLEQARDEQTWEPVWFRLDDVVRQRLADLSTSGHPGLELQHTEDNVRILISVSSAAYKTLANEAVSARECRFILLEVRAEIAIRGTKFTDATEPLPPCKASMRCCGYCHGRYIFRRLGSFKAGSHADGHSTQSGWQTSSPPTGEAGEAKNDVLPIIRYLASDAINLYFGPETKTSKTYPYPR
ncbi:Phosphatidylinositol 3- and 4-kinase family protein [Leishmania donovani]|uniref:Phosphatidylinositol 3-and 4-kinase family protein n=1 Tax=Leishmania donovani TaxID=5661 RepID=A0A504XCC5_LEIDO|nr:Phosphatidylinositol 3- and 4-kinase family protein [Leishmania donovani]